MIHPAIAHNTRFDEAAFAPTVWAAASVTAVPRSLAAVLAPLLAGWLLAMSSFGWPLVLAGILKAAYDLALLRQFAHRDAH